MARYPKNSSPKLTNELIEKFSTALKNGAYIETAAAYCGISKDTFYRWLKKAPTDDENGNYRKLSDAIERAWAIGEMADLEVINKAALGSPDRLALDENGKVIVDVNGRPVVEEYGCTPNWRASAWRLERKFPSRWGKNVSVNLKRDANIEIVFVDDE